MAEAAVGGQRMHSRRSERCMRHGIDTKIKSQRRSASLGFFLFTDSLQKCRSQPHLPFSKSVHFH